MKGILITKLSFLPGFWKWNRSKKWRKSKNNKNQCN